MFYSFGFVLHWLHSLNCCYEISLQIEVVNIWTQFQIFLPFSGAGTWKTSAPHTAQRWIQSWHQSSKPTHWWHVYTQPASLLLLLILNTWGIQEYQLKQSVLLAQQPSNQGTFLGHNRWWWCKSWSRECAM